MHCRLVPRTCRLLLEAGAPPGMVSSLPALQGSQELVDFLRADPGTGVTFHAASTNGRLTIQLCLSGCDGDSSSYIQVGPEKLQWRHGEPIVFDDSFLHSVRIDPAAPQPRWVLSVQVMHPSIDSPERYGTFFGDHDPFPGDLRENADELDGGPPPPALEGTRPWPFPSEDIFFSNQLQVPVLLYCALWGPWRDGPEVLIGEILSIKDRPFDEGKGVALPALAHRTRLIAKNVTDGQQLAAWRVDARDGANRHFILPKARATTFDSKHKYHSSFKQ